jgi:hypothetical protein
MKEKDIHLVIKQYGLIKTFSLVEINTTDKY